MSVSFQNLGYFRGVNAADFGEIVHGVVSLVSVKLALAGTLPVGHKEVGLFRVKLQAHHCAQANGAVAVNFGDDAFVRNTDVEIGLAA